MDLLTPLPHGDKDLATSELSLDGLYRTALCLEAFCLIYVAILFRALLARFRGDDQLKLLTVNDHQAAAIDLCAYLFAIVFTLLDSFKIEGESLLRQSSEMAYSGLTALLCFGIGQLLIDIVFFWGLNPVKEINQNNNIAVATARGAALIAVSLMVRSLIAHPQPWEELMIWGTVGLSAVLILGFIFQLVTPYDDLEEIRQGNLAAAFPLGGAWLAAGFTVETALFGESVNLVDDLIAVGLYLLFASLALILIRLICQKIILRGVDLNNEITQDRNYGVGLFEATLYISLAEITSYFLS